MFIQGNLQVIFDALYAMGVIDPVLKMDWSEVNDEIVRDPAALEDAVNVVNSCSGDYQELLMRLKALDKKRLSFIALEVAREFAEFQDRSELH